MDLKIEDLIPHEATLKLSTIETPLILRPWSLRVRIWALGQYTDKGLEKILREQSPKELSEIAFFMLKDESKKHFKDLEHFQDSILSPKDILALSLAVLGTIGMSEPIIEQLVEKQNALNKTPITPTQKKKK